MNSIVLRKSLHTFRKSLISLLITISCVVFLYSVPKTTTASEHDALISEFKKNDWESHFLNPQSIERFKDEKMFNKLVDIIDNKGLDWRIRIRGIKLLGEINTPKAASRLVEMFNDSFFNAECPSIKSYVAAALGNFKNDNRVIDALISGINDGELLVREASINALGELGNTKAVSYLIAVLDDKSFAVKISAIIALGKIGDTKAIPYLEQIVRNDGDQLIKNEAITALKRLNNNHKM